MKAKLELSIVSMLLSAATIISCGDDPSNPNQPTGSAGQSSGGSGGNAAGSGSVAGKPAGGSGGSASAGSSGTAGGGTTSGGSAGSGGSGGHGGGGGEGGSDVEQPSIDCSQVPAKPIMSQELVGPRAYHDVAFDSAGNLIGNNNEDLLKTALDGTPKIFVAGIGLVEGMDSFPNGDLVAAVTSMDEFKASVVRITPQGGHVELAPLDSPAYGVRIGVDGFVYAGTYEGLLKIDATTGQKVTMPAPDEGWTPRVMDYSPDKKKMYVGTLANFGGPIDPEDPTVPLPDEPGETSGTVYVYDLDEKGTPVGKPKVFATDVGGGYHDALGVDACGNLYVSDFYTTSLYRITPAGQVTLYQGWADSSENDSGYGHGLEWGTGADGWDKNSIYLPQPYDNNTVLRLEFGVPARPR